MKENKWLFYINCVFAVISLILLISSFWFDNETARVITRDVSLSVFVSSFLGLNYNIIDYHIKKRRFLADYYRKLNEYYNEMKGAVNWANENANVLLDFIKNEKEALPEYVISESREKVSLEIYEKSKSLAKQLENLNLKLNEERTFSYMEIQKGYLFRPKNELKMVFAELNELCNEFCFSLNKIKQYVIQDLIEKEYLVVNLERFSTEIVCEIEKFNIDGKMEEFEENMKCYLCLTHLKNFLKDNWSKNL